MNKKLLKAVNNNDLKKIRKLLKKGISIDTQNNEGQTILMKACNNFLVEINVIHLLLEYNPNINIQDNKRWTAIMFCALNNDIAKLKLILTKGHNINFSLKNKDNYTALDLAIFNNSLESILLLLNFYNSILNIDFVINDKTGWLTCIKTFLFYKKKLFFKLHNI